MRAKRVRQRSGREIHARRHNARITRAPKRNHSAIRLPSLTGNAEAREVSAAAAARVNRLFDNNRKSLYVMRVPV